MKQLSLAPTTKITAGALAGALTSVIVWALRAKWNLEMPAEIAVALSTVISFLTGWITPPGANDQITES